MEAVNKRRIQDAGLKSKRRDELGRKLCRHPDCEKLVPKGRREWCGQVCVDDWMVRNNPGFAREQLQKRDKGVCAQCGRDCEALRNRLNRILSHTWNGTEVQQKRSRRYQRLLHRYSSGRLGYGTWHLKTLWDADHIKPVVMGGGGCGLDNLRTLCVCCHLKETKALAGRRAEFKRWQRFVQKSKQNGTFQADHVERLEGFWSAATQFLGTTPPLPVTEPNDTGIALTWDNGDAVLSLEIESIGYHWFFKDRTKETVDGTEDPVSTIPTSFFERLKQLKQH